MRSSWKSMLLAARSLYRDSSENGALSRSPFLIYRILDSRYAVADHFSHGPSAALAQNPLFLRRRFSSSPDAVDGEDRKRALALQIFSKPIGIEHIHAELESSGVKIDHDLVNLTLQSLKGNTESAWRLFLWSLEQKDDGILSSKSFNLMLRILSANGKSEEFWNLIEIMKGREFEISGGSYLNASQGFQKLGMEKDVHLLKEMYFFDPEKKASGRICSMICKILMEIKGQEDINKYLDDLGISLSPDLITGVIESMKRYPNKVWIFFLWAEKNSSSKLDVNVHNAILELLVRKDCQEKFTSVLERMMSEGHEIKKETYVTVSDQFYKKKMVTQAIELYEFAMAGSKYLYFQDFVLLLKMIVASKDLDMELVARTIRIYKKGGNSIKGSAFGSVLKSLTSVGRLGECHEVLKAMEQGGFVADGCIHNQVVVSLCNATKSDAAFEYVERMEKLGHSPSLNTWKVMIQKLCLAGKTEKASSCLDKVIGKNSDSDVRCVLEALIKNLSWKNHKAAVEILKRVVEKKQVHPLRSTFVLLIETLLEKENLKEAKSLLELMRTQKLSPCLNSFISYLAKSGSVDDILGVLKATTGKEFPSKGAFLRLFEGLLSSKRHSVAHDLLSRSPWWVSNHANVLDLFNSKKKDEVFISAA